MNPARAILTIMIGWIVIAAVHAAPAYAEAQVYGQRTPYMTVSTSNVGEIDVYYDQGRAMLSTGMLRLSGDNLDISVYCFPTNMQPAEFSITNAKSGTFSNDGLRISGRTVFEKPVDISVLSQDQLALWDNARSAAGQLLENSKFVDFLRDKYGEDAGTYMDAFEKLRDGYYVPDVWVQMISISRVTRVVASTLGQENKIGRGYSIGGPEQIELTSTTPEGNPNPDLYLTVHNPDIGSWSIHENSSEGKNQIDGRYSHKDSPLTLEGSRVRLVHVADMLNYIRNQAPELEKLGVLEPGNDLVFLIDKFLAGLDAHPMEITPPPELH